MYKCTNHTWRPFTHPSNITEVHLTLFVLLVLFKHDIYEIQQQYIFSETVSPLIWIIHRPQCEHFFSLELLYIEKKAIHSEDCGLSRGTGTLSLDKYVAFKMMPPNGIPFTSTDLWWWWHRDGYIETWEHKTKTIR